MIYLKIFAIFLKMGTFIFGAGHALAFAIQQEVVSRGWMSMEDFQDGWSIATALPGPITAKLAVYTGYKVAGVLGAISAVIGYILPSVLMMGIVSFFFLKFKDSKTVEAILKGIKPAVVALIAVAAYKFLNIGAVADVRGYIILTAAFGLLAFAGVSPIKVILGAAAIGLTYLIKP
ncbi:TPA: chromate transporter [Candidatus Poribacteria bacterium]|nr:chromate transporter [Candidatus Poribacteria bacterium]